MSKTNTTENDYLKMELQGTDPAWRAGANRYLALFTGDPGETGSTAAEATYTGYSRIPIACAGGWTDGGATFTNAALAQFGLCTVGTNVLTHVAVMTAASGGQMLRYGALSSPLSVSPGIQPQFAAGQIAITED